MDEGREKQNECQVENSWIPKTPLKHNIGTSQVIYTNRQLEQQVNGLGSKGLSQKISNGTLGACLDSMDDNWEAALGRKSITCDPYETCREFPTDGSATWNFTSLLALQDQASRESTSSASHRPWLNAKYRLESQFELAYDLNLTPGETADSFSSKACSQMFPVTPDKAARVEGEQVPQMQYLCTDERASQERNELENGIASTAVDTDKLQKSAKDSSRAAVCELVNENHSPGKDGSHAISLSETPQLETPQQKPRRRKHRPKVITEGKPRPRKPVTPKPALNTESPTGKRKYVRKKPVNDTQTTPPSESTGTPTGKRKYVRKKPLNKDSTNSPVEATGETTDPVLEPANKSCRRSLNFDIEEQPRDDSSKCKPNSNGDSQPQAQDVSRGNQPKSTVAIGRGIEVMVETTQTGIAYDLTRSVNQMLKDYISLPEKQIPTLPLPAKTYPLRSKQNDNSQRRDAKAEDPVTAHSVQQNTTKIMLQADTQLPPVNPNISNCSNSTTLAEEAQANGSKRKLYSFIQQPDTCSTNLTGIQHNALSSYQKMPAVLFPSIFKKKRTEKGQNSTTSSTSSVTAAKDIVRQEITCPQRDAKGNPSISEVNGLTSAPYFNANGHLQHKLQPSSSDFCQIERSRKKRSRGPTRARDLASLTKIVRGEISNFASTQVPLDSNVLQVGGSNSSHACIEALVAGMRGTLTTKKRTKKRVSLVNSVSSSTNWEQSQGKIILYNQNQFSAKSLGAPAEAIWEQMFSIDAIAEQLQHLDISRESSRIVRKEQNALVPYVIENNQQSALVLYRRAGTIVPFTAFEPIKKRHPRPKVDLDEETNRVWKLLLGNINSEGIDGTDEEKIKWWEEEREVFRGRVNSFIARMHLVQGDRRFSPWKGSVVDSVVGVFLTQNVSDHLSSSAFMSMAARFPLKSKSNNRPSYEEGTSSIIEKPPIVCMPDLEDAIKWNEVPNQSICDQSSMNLHDFELDEEREVVNSNESSTSSIGIVSSRCGLETCYESRSTTEITKSVDTRYIGDMRRATNDALSSQNSVVSSQNSVDSTSAQTAERKEAISGNNSEADPVDGCKFNSLASSSSFMELLIKAGSNKLHEVYSPGNGMVLFDQNSKYEFNKTQNVGNDFHMENTYNVDSSKISLDGPVTPSNNCHSHPISNLGVLADECFKIITEETGCYKISKSNSRNDMKELSSFAEESASQITDENNLTMTAQEAPRSPTANGPFCSEIQEDMHLTTQTQSGLVGDVNIVRSLTQVENNEMQQNFYLPNLSRETLSIVESINKKEKNSQKTAESNLIEHGFSEIKELNEKNAAATRKAKSRRVGKEIRADVDWDELRKQAEADGRKRERIPNTMDSLDWEAVRCAEVHEIAKTIKERGMNNMLAERIKDFLNRLVREHGSIDLEWLRDIPPDKAKEYLLSIRGLGLKSVECVRLLTLHHLAFPVDTNVGRIAVRLGWVPLQPLPESLQLHLLELYPVLESIQKYLWPRLCKLDQRTLYELHYQMITFGKVFCTKSKPNCNACPMRGECRHFASAFASARLALPGPEEKGIVSATENRTNEQNPATMVDQQLLLPPQETEQSVQNQLSQSNWQSEARYGVSYCEPIVEEPSSPEPERKQITENDMEDTFCEDPDEIPTIKLNIEEFTQNLQNYMQNNMELQEGDMSKALVALTAEAASIPTPKLKNVSRLRTEHQVYELPDSHPLLQGLYRREPDDPCSYLLAIWTPGETANSIQPPESRCNAQEYGKLCDEKTCFSCNGVREANSQIVRGTLLIPCRTAMRGSFPLNGTYFQVNEVFADHDSSLDPIDVPRSWIWNLPRRTVYFGTSIPTIFKGLTTEGIQHCFWRGYVCVRGFDQKTRAPRPLMARLHFPASKLKQNRGRDSND
ncbi:hypothetical protein JCGZ_23695 [Jatropha curcas]|uniref:HhH-GPD domain-containing protein n=1 Tax=Jatropha curcas TaxID=180498 RepID=A0A067LE41_JATCU|nr:DNA glycosylase/AP lyase ROS1 [Jatropha curcas]XP_012066502.1 DNA glycosylase/AP lyase ROS1 [Jatropha curcas]KDP42755.1 hypothetical protein JCGZ_23695 [Jatropha curcas]